MGSVILISLQLERPMTRKAVSVYDDQDQLLASYDTTSADQVTFTNNIISMIPTAQMINNIGCYHILLQPGKHSTIPLQRGKHSTILLPPGKHSTILLQPGKHSTILLQPGKHSTILLQPGKHSTILLQPGKHPTIPLQPCLYYLSTDCVFCYIDHRFSTDGRCAP